MKVLVVLAVSLWSLASQAGEAVIGAAEKVSYDASVQSSGFSTVSGGIGKYRIAASTACHYLVGADPTATSLGTFLPANVVDYVMIPSGQKIAVIKATGGSAGIMTINKVK